MSGEFATFGRTCLAAGAALLKAQDLIDGGDTAGGLKLVADTLVAVMAVVQAIAPNGPTIAETAALFYNNPSADELLDSLRFDDVRDPSGSPESTNPESVHSAFSPLTCNATTAKDVPEKL